MSIESIASLKALGGGHSASRGPSNSKKPAGQQDGMLRDTARELEQLFDEFQALRNSISAEPELPSPPKQYVPEAPLGSLISSIGDKYGRGEASEPSDNLMAELTLREREINSMRQNQQDKDSMLRAYESKTARLEADLKSARDQMRLQQRRSQVAKEDMSAREKTRQAEARHHAANLKVARDMDMQKAHQLTKQAPILEVLNTLESDGATKQRQIDELEHELKTVKKLVREKDKVIEEVTCEVNQLKDRPDSTQDLQNDVKMLLHTIEGLQAENRNLVRLEAEKSAVIQELSLTIQDQGLDEHKVAELQNQIQAANLQNKELMHEVHALQQAEEKRTKRLLQEEQQDGIMTSKEWMDERRKLKVQLEKATDRYAECERSVKAQDVKIDTLVKRIGTITAAVKESKSRRMPSSLPLHQNGQEVTGEVGDRRCVGIDEIELWVPAEMYTFLETELRVLRAEVEEKHTILLERDDLIEGLERKVDVLTKARAAENVRGQREISKLSSELEETRASFLKHGTPRALQASQRSALQASKGLKKRRGSINA
eukprot:TRINITY_DN18550_c0_g1_i1.p1 TRINITY_DN18550_c0_g1~~TRINITY_DN18550_c0_g1_i1.p1  ORF type:complete len:546 (+),score=171.84 TRINITY_DN18550_c0_g1_i1:221-1858(+)